MKFRYLLFSLPVFILAVTDCGNKSTEPGGNRAPAIPSSPSPADGAANTAISVTLTWQCSDPDGDSLTFDVYLGLSQTPSVVSSNQTEMSYLATGLQNSSSYYWKVAAKDGIQHSTSSPVWRFSTAANSPPNAPSNPSPANGATGQSTRLTLSWQCSDPDGDQLFYRLPFGTYPDSLHWEYYWDNIIQPSFDPGPLEPNTRYFWRVVALDSSGNETFGPVWNFMTIDNLHIIGRYYTPSLAWRTIFKDQYAFVRCSYSTEVLDISNPANPMFVTSYYGNDAIMLDLISGQYAYGSTRSAADSLKIFEISDVLNPIFLGGTSAPGISNKRLSGGYLFSVTERDLRVFNVSNPYLPTMVATYGYRWDDQALDLELQGDYAYIAWSVSGCFEIADISNPSEPLLAGSYVIPGIGIEKAFVADNYAYVSRGGLYILDVFNPSSPTLVSHLETAGGDLYFVNDSYAVLGDFYNGLLIVEVADPSNPTALVRLSLPDHTYGIDFHEDYIYAAVEDSGIVILEFNP